MQGERMSGGTTERGEWAAKMERQSGDQVDSGGVARDDS